MDDSFIIDYSSVERSPVDQLPIVSRFSFMLDNSLVEVKAEQPFRLSPLTQVGKDKHENFLTFYLDLKQL